MIELKTTVTVSGVTAKQIFEFMLQCTDQRYQAWWPGTHLYFHTEKHFPGYVGNLVYFDEMIGERRLKWHAVIREVEENRKIVWQLTRLATLPVWIELGLNENRNNVTVSHTLRAGYSGTMKPLDAIFRCFLNRKFETELNAHAAKEFVLLAKRLASTA